MNRPIWISSGEVSGDIHGGELLQALGRAMPAQDFIGMGGPQMRKNAHFTGLFRMEDLSVMGITEVIGHLPKIFRLLAEIKAEMIKRRPRAVIVIDAPDFHFRVIRAARELNIPVYYYISPKVWAWRQGRARFIKENVFHLFSILPFEQKFYRRFGMEVDYIGNPLVDLVNFPSLASIQPQAGKIGLLPGSRNKEVASLIPEFAEAARLLLTRRPDLDFHMVSAPGRDPDQLRSLWPKDLPLTIHSAENRYALMRSCEMLIAASGTVTLEAALTGTPTLVTYKVSPLSALVGRALIKVPYISLPNLVMEREVFPELIQGACDGESLAEKAWDWLKPEDHGKALATVREGLDELRRRMGAPGAADRAAERIAEDMRHVSQ